MDAVQIQGSMDQIVKAVADLQLPEDLVRTCLIGALAGHVGNAESWIEGRGSLFQSYQRVVLSSASAAIQTYSGEMPNVTGALQLLCRNLAPDLWDEIAGDVEALAKSRRIQDLADEILADYGQLHLYWALCGVLGPTLSLGVISDHPNQRLAAAVFLILGGCAGVSLALFQWVLKKSFSRYRA